MQRTEPFSNPQELRAFVGKLYIYLVDEMKNALSKVTHTNMPSPHMLLFCPYFLSPASYQVYSDEVDDDSQDEIQLSSSQLRHFAREAQLTGDYQQAAHYYQEVR